MNTPEEKINDWTRGRHFSRILLYTIVFHFSFKLALIPDWKNGGRRLQAWRYKGRGVESRATEQEGGVAEQEGEATEKAIEGDSIAPIGKLVA